MSRNPCDRHGFRSTHGESSFGGRPGDLGHQRNGALIKGDPATNRVSLQTTVD